MSGFLASLGFDVRDEKIKRVRAKKEKVVKSIKDKLIEFCEKQILLIESEGLESSNKGKCWSGFVEVEPGKGSIVREFYVRGERNRKYYFGLEDVGKVTYVIDSKDDIIMYIKGLLNGIRECDEKDFMSGGDKECVYVKGRDIISVDSGEVIMVLENKEGKKKK